MVAGKTPRYLCKCTSINNKIKFTNANDYKTLNNNKYGEK